MQEAAEHGAAEGLVVRGAGQVQVPGLVDVMRRTHRLPRDLRQHQEAAVFLGHRGRIAQRPAVVVGQPHLEAERVVGRVEAVGLDARQQRGGGGSGCRRAMDW